MRLINYTLRRQRLALLLCAAALSAVSVTAQTAGEDFTGTMTNPSFEEGTTGWTITGGGKAKTKNENEVMPGTGTGVFNAWTGKTAVRDISQTVTGLPAGNYVLSAYVRTWGEGDLAGEQHVYAKTTLRDGTTDSTYVSENLGAEGVGTTAWQLLSAPFAVYDEGAEVTLGVTAHGDFQADAFTLTFHSAFGDSELDYAWNSFNKKYTAVQAYVDALYEAGLTAIADELSGRAEAIETEAGDTETVESYAAGVQALDALMSEYAGIEDRYNALLSLVDQCNTICETTDYPDKQAFYDAIEDAGQFDESAATKADLDSLLASLTQSLLDYRMSQTKTASEDTPADMTFLVQSPNFFDASKGIAPGDASNDNRGTWGTSQGWTTANVGGGDYRPGYKGGRPCWNSWSNSFTSMDIHQDMEGLPSGYYYLTCAGMTYEGQLTDQHAYIRSAMGEAVSDTLRTDLGDTPEGWEALRTGLVLVNDGKVRIGFASTSGGDTRGWFCATDFALHYCGAAKSDEIRKNFDARLKEYEAQRDTMALAADRAAFAAVIAACRTVADDGIEAALDTLNKAQAEAQRSVDAYDRLHRGIYAALADSIQHAYTGHSLTVAQQLLARTDLYLTSASATWTALADITTRLSALIGKYLPVLTEVESAEMDDTDAAALLAATVQKQLDRIAAADSLPSAADYDSNVAELGRVLTACRMDALYKQGTDDYTAAIANANVDTESGWTYERVNGNVNSDYAAAFDGNTSSRYHHSWNATAGALRFTVSQTIEGLPNGTYRLRAMTRLKGCKPGIEGAYLFAIADGDSANAQFAHVRLEKMNYTHYFPEIAAADGTDSICYVEGVYGSLWEEAYEYVDKNGDDDSNILSKIFATNGGKGYGWRWSELDIEVRGHKLTIGQTTDSALTAGHTDTEGNPCVPFSGNQISADNYRLTLVKLSDNAGWSPITGVKDLRQDQPSTAPATTGDLRQGDEVYAVSGARVAPSAMQRGGIYIVRRDGRTYKLTVQ